MFKVPLKSLKFLQLLIIFLPIYSSCGQFFNAGNLDSPQTPVTPPTEANAILLRHSTGGNLFGYGGGAPDNMVNPSYGVGDDFTAFNAANGTNYKIQKRAYPGTGYPWDNYPYDFWNIFVNHGDVDIYSGQETLRVLTQTFDVIIWKHCYPGAQINDDTGTPDISSYFRTLENYKLQYNALKSKMHEYPDTKFIVWTLALRTESGMSSTYRTNSKAFVDWVRDVWDEPGDNIYLWDLYYLQTNKETVQYLYYPRTPSDSHPSDAFNSAAGPLFAQRVIDVIRGEGDSKPITGETTLGGDWNLVP